MNRKLTTIMSADVAGYSRLMGDDEEGTHTRLMALCQELLEPAIDAHNGTVVKRTGDGLLSEFASVVDAVRCAVAIQAGASDRNAGLPPGQRIAFRIGVNIGDVIAEAGDIFGDGVNVAVRLEGLAEPGEIVVSRAVRDQIRDRLQLRFEDLGERSVKNIARPVRAFRVEAGDVAPRGVQGVERRRIRRGMTVSAAVFGTAVALIAAHWPQFPNVLASSASALSRVSAAAPVLRRAAPPRLSIVVLPFANLGGDPQQDYLVDGITDSLTTDLSHALPGSFVVSRATAFTYKGKTIDPVRVGRDLNVRYLLEGSVATNGDLVRVNAHLIDAQDNRELWAERFDCGRTNVLAIQDQIVARLSRAVGLEMVDIEAKRSERAGSASAIDLVMRGRSIANRPATRETMIAARALFERALDQDAGNVDALAGIGTTYVFEVLNSYYKDGREERLQKADPLIQRALAIDSRHITALKARAALLRAQGNFDDAIVASEAVIAQNPGEPWAYKEIGLSMLYLGRFAEALGWFERADQIGPRDPSRWIWLGAMGRVQFFLGHDEEAIRLLRLSADANPGDIRAYALLAAVFALSGRKDAAAAALQSCLRLRPEMTIKLIFDEWSVPLEATSQAYLRQHARFREGLRLAGMAEE